MTSTTTAMKPIIMMNTSPDMDDPFADLPSLTEDTAAAQPSLVSPLEFGTGIKYVVEQQQQQSSSSTDGDMQKESDATETTVDDNDDDAPETPGEVTTTEAAAVTATDE